jgi:hypothetical protein
MTEKKFEKLREKCKKKDRKEATRIINLYYQVRLHSISLFSYCVTLFLGQSVGIRAECSLDGFVFSALWSERRCI